MKDFDKVARKFKEVAIGMDDLDLELLGVHPPYNISTEDDITYLVDIAVAGYDKQNLQVTIEGNNCVVIGNKVNENKTYKLQGITQKQFRIVIPIAKNMDVTGATYGDGMLVLTVEKSAANIINVNIN